MVTFRSNNNNNNNNRRPPFRSNNNRRPPFRSNNEGSKFSNNDSFRRSVPGRNNHNAVKLIEKYNDLAREALANEDKILSENYFQHADHFTRVQNEQESIRMARVNSSTAAIVKPVEASPTADIEPTEVKDEKPSKIEIDTVKKPITESAVKRVVKTIEKKTVEKKSAAS
jgi:5'-3' exonuclease